MTPSSRKQGFSLVELVIVVVILGVIAAIAVPRISRGAKGADEAAVKQDLAILRSAIEMYAAEHGGTFPGSGGTEASLRDQLLKYTDRAGAAVDTKDATHVYGPYLRKDLPPAPVGAMAGQNTVKVITTGDITAAVDNTTGWVYHNGTGQILVNSTAVPESGVGTYGGW